jgi:DNA/RNA-binding domain of Phe-tRNA-synthetase-like protein
MSAMLLVTDALRAAHPGAAAGMLVMDNVANPSEHPELERRKTALEGRLRDRYGRLTRTELLALPTLQPYAEYYGRFKKTYHVQLQLESVALKGKPLPRVAALVEAMFMAELENVILTAGHDLTAVALPVRADVAREGDRYVLMNGSEREAVPGDMMMVDGKSIISTVLYGPDRRTRIGPDTADVLFAAYAPAGIGEDAVREHLEDVRGNVLLLAPGAATELLATLATS